MDDLAATLRPWYKRWWGIVALIVGVLVVVGALFFAGLLVYYVYQIRQGHGELVRPQPSGATQVFAATVQDSVADRNKVETQDSPTLGRPNAPTVIVAFVDFKCPYCKDAAPVLHEIAQKYGYKVKIIARDFPAESIHPGTTELSVLARCAYEQNHYWDMYDVLFNNQSSITLPLTDDEVQQLADAAGVDLTALNTCRHSALVAQRVERDYFDGVSAGVHATPTYFINGERIDGEVPWDEWQRYLDKVK